MGKMGKNGGGIKNKVVEGDGKKLVFIRGVGNECRVDEARCAKIPPGWAPGVLITGGLITLYFKDTFTVYK